MTKSKLETTLETLVDLYDLHRKQTIASFDKVNASIEALTLNVAQLASQQKQSAVNIDNLTQAIREQNLAINGHLAVAQTQSSNIAELTKLATKLIERN